MSCQQEGYNCPRGLVDPIVLGVIVAQGIDRVQLDQHIDVTKSVSYL